MKHTTIRLSDRARDCLDQLCKFYGMSKSDVLRLLIERDWGNVGGQAKRIAEFAESVRRETG